MRIESAFSIVRIHLHSGWVSPPPPPNARRPAATPSTSFFHWDLTLIHRRPLDRSIGGRRRGGEKGSLRRHRAQRVARRLARRRRTSSRCRASSRRGPCRPSDSFFRMSWVTVMMWQPIASAWKMFSSSRGLAQISSACGAALQELDGGGHQRHRIAAGVGDAAGEDRDVRRRAARRAPSTTSRTCSSVMSAVTFSLTPACERRWIKIVRGTRAACWSPESSRRRSRPRWRSRAPGAPSRRTRRRTPRTRSAGRESPPGRRCANAR